MLLGREPTEPEVIAVMHLPVRKRTSSIAWVILLAALAVCYAAIAASFAGILSAPRGSLTILSAATVGCVAAFIYLASALRELRC